jgi:hypothetical protein
LQHIYDKLQVHSRTELVRALRDLVRERDGLNEILEPERTLESFDIFALDDFLFGDERLIRRDLRVGRLRFVAATRDALQSD